MAPPLPISPPHNSETTATMGNRSPARTLKPSILADGFLLAGGAAVALLLFWALYSVVVPSSDAGCDRPSSSFSTYFVTPPRVFPLPPAPMRSTPNPGGCPDLRHDPSSPTFYDDPALAYTVGHPVGDWDQKRREWLDQHPSFKAGAGERVLMLSGSQPRPCRHPTGDHLLLRFLKNKVDYCRLHGIDFFYNTALLHPQMFSFWAKIPLARAAMVAHPESEWIWWVDSDAVFTDMEFRLPLHKYAAHNLVVHGWPNLVYENKSWTSLNAGVFLVRNCQWAMDFLEVWAGMGPQSPEYERWGQTLKAEFKDKVFPESDDQSALVYLLLRQKDRWGDKIYLESDYYFQGYWVDIVGRLENMSQRYVEMERRAPVLRRRRAEKVAEAYGEEREGMLVAEGWKAGRDGWLRPFVTHFTGCQPCGGQRNEGYSEEECWEGMQRALNFADDQVLRSYGFGHPDLLDTADVKPLPYDFPAANT